MKTEKPLTLGSLFDGSGGFPLGGLLAGITPVWASEIEPFPIRVTTKRLPFMKHYGNISAMDGGRIEPVDIITFGSPCQDMSVAGRRDGLDGKRSSLFYEAVRIIKEMRYATDGKYPKWICWENVPGAFSSNKGEDFKAVLEAVIGIVEPETEVPMPEKAQWPYADLYMGDGWSVAYRTFDAQYWGVPQRRRRIYLVADLAGGSAGKILFESEGLSGYSAESFRSWQRAAGGFTPCVGAAGFDGYNGSLTDDAGIVPAAVALENHPTDSRVKLSEDGNVQTLTSRIGTGGNNVPLMMKIRSGCEGGGKGALIQENKSATLSCNNDQTLFEPCGWNGGQVSPTLTKQNAGGNQRMPDKGNFTCVLQPFGISSKDSNAMKSDNPHSGIYKAETARTLDGNGGNPSCNQGGIAVVALEGNGARPSHKGSGYSNEGVSFTLNATEQHGVAYGLDRATYNMGQKAKFGIAVEEEVEPTIVAKGPGAVAESTYGHPPVVMGAAGFCTEHSAKSRSIGYEEETSPTLRAGTVPAAVELASTLMATDYKDPPLINDKDDADYIVRRLTPTECARLQGFPDWWCSDLGTEKPTDEEMYFWHKVFKTYSEVTGCKMKSDKQVAKWLKDPYSDSAEYKMWGNGVALPCVWFVLCGIVWYAQSGGDNAPI